MKIVFFGTPDFAVNILREIADDVTLVVTQPDKPIGRKRVVTPSPVKVFAIQAGIKVLTPIRLKTAEFADELKQSGADVFITAAYGRILPKSVLDIPMHGCINVHASLLPAYRGAAPIQRAIADGLSTTGITIMKMDEGIDTGDIILQTPIPITDTDTGGTLAQKLSAAGASSLKTALLTIEKGAAVFTKQDDDKASYAPMITKQTLKLDFNKTAREAANHIRAYQPFEQAYATFNGLEIKLISAAASDIDGSLGKPGEVISINKDGITIACFKGALLIKEIIPQGGKKMDAYAFTLGRDIKPGDCFT